MAEIINFSEERAERVLREREAREEEEAQRQDAERERDESLDGIRLALGDLDALAEISCKDMSPVTRGFVASGIMVRVAALRELLGVA